MTSRERQASGGVGVAERPATVRPAPPGPAPASTPPLSWNDLFHHLTPPQRAEVLSLAARQGVVYGHQLPLVEPRRSPLSALLGGRMPDLPSVVVEPRPLIDDALDDWQRQAVWRALQSPDVCLVHGRAGSGKTRIIAEVLRQATAANLRVLLAAPSAAAIDAVLSRVRSHPGLYAVRCVAPGEDADSLPAAARAMTLAARLCRLREDAVSGARLAERTAQGALNRLEAQAAVWEQLESLCSEQEAMSADQRERVSRLGRLTEIVQAEIEAVRDGGTGSGPLAQAVRDVVRQRTEAREQLSRLRAEVAQTQGELAAQRQRLDAERARLEPLRQAQQDGRWWTPTWWRARSEADLGTHLEQVLVELEKLGQDEQLLQSKSRSHDEQEARIEAQATDKLVSLAVSEAEARGRALDEQISAAAHLRQSQQERWQALVEQLSLSSRPTAPTADDLARSRVAWNDEKTEAMRRLDFARRWAEALATAAPAWPDRLARLANVVAAPMTALSGGLLFGDKAAVPFDLVIVDEAEQLTDAELQALARRARRCVLLGELPAEPPAEAPTRNGPARGLRPSFVRPSVFQRLWQQVHTDPRRLSVRWVGQEGRLCCQLRPIPPESARWVEREAVLDRADVELCIVAPPRAEPVLAEVVFPGTTSVDEAKRFIFQELQELALETTAPALHWHEEAERFWLRFGEMPGEADQAVALEAGVVEWVRSGGTALPFETLAVEFRREAGWDRARAEEWLRRHSGLRDLGRSMALSQLRRMGPGLAAVVDDLLGQPPATDTPLPPSVTWLNWTAPLVFVPVPGLRNGDGRRGTRGSQRGGARFEGRGAGLEFDLADTAHPPQLPPELRQQLPATGLVNLMEAQAIVRAVEKLLSDPTFRAEAALLAEVVPLAVVALYPAQARLLYLLLRQSPVLAREAVRLIGPDGGPPIDAAPGLSLEVSTPAAWRHRECLALMLSLTRSHSHRAVQIGEQEGWLPLALTRSRGRLILVGDPGTLVRRTQWQGLVDRLDEAAAARERELIGRLVAYLQGHGARLDCFQLCEGSSA